MSDHTDEIFRRALHAAASNRRQFSQDERLHVQRRLDMMEKQVREQVHVKKEPVKKEAAKRTP